MAASLNDVVPSSVNPEVPTQQYDEDEALAQAIAASLQEEDSTSKQSVRCDIGIDMKDRPSPPPQMSELTLKLYNIVGLHLYTLKLQLSSCSDYMDSKL